jgi:hypothetical protein
MAASIDQKAKDRSTFKAAVVKDMMWFLKWTLFWEILFVWMEADARACKTADYKSGS